MYGMYVDFMFIPNLFAQPMEKIIYARVLSPRGKPKVKEFALGTQSTI
jgi:hypothetical protein